MFEKQSQLNLIAENIEEFERKLNDFIQENGRNQISLLQPSGVRKEIPGLHLRKPKRNHHISQWKQDPGRTCAYKPTSSNLR